MNLFTFFMLIFALCVVSLFIWLPRMDTVIGKIAEVITFACAIIMCIFALMGLLPNIAGLIRGMFFFLDF